MAFWRAKIPIFAPLRAQPWWAHSGQRSNLRFRLSHHLVIALGSRTAQLASTQHQQRVPKPCLSGARGSPTPSHTGGAAASDIRDPIAKTVACPSAPCTPTSDSDSALDLLALPISPVRDA